MLIGILGVTVIVLTVIIYGSMSLGGKRSGLMMAALALTAGAVLVPAGFGVYRGGFAAFTPSKYSPEILAMVDIAAEHESGHRAVADEYGWWVVSSWIRSDGSGGTIAPFVLVHGKFERLVYGYAGAVAAGTGVAAEADFLTADRILADFPETDRSAIKQTAKDEAARIIAKRADSVASDTTQLQEHGRAW